MNNLFENLKVFVWNIIYMPIFRFRYWRTIETRKKLNIVSSVKTVDLILKEKYSVCRFGDGELQMMSHFLKEGNTENFSVNTFQNYDKCLASRLIEVFRSSDKKILICLPYQFKDSSISRFKVRVFWEREWLLRRNLLQEIGINKRFGDSTFTRFYMGRKDIRDIDAYVMRLQSIWGKRKVVLIEGKFSRLGAGNDLFSTAESVERIVCPAVNAFHSYSDIMNTVQNIEKSKLILIALGHTATVLAYDLALAGYQAIDIGHLDIEYEWYKMGATTKTAVANKYVNEVPSGRIGDIDPDHIYEQQVIKRIDG